MNKQKKKILTKGSKKELKQQKCVTLFSTAGQKIEKKNSVSFWVNRT